MRTEDVQVLHGFETESQARDYLSSQLFSKEIVAMLGHLLAADSEARFIRYLRNRYKLLFQDKKKAY